MNTVTVMKKMRKKMMKKLLMMLLEVRVERMIMMMVLEEMKVLLDQGELQKMVQGRILLAMLMLSMSEPGPGVKAMHRRIQRERLTEPVVLVKHFVSTLCWTCARWKWEANILISLA